MSLDEEEDKEEGEEEEEKKDVTRRSDRFFWKKVCPLDSNLSPPLPPPFLITLLVEQALCLIGTSLEKTIRRYLDFPVK